MYIGSMTGERTNQVDQRPTESRKRSGFRRYLRFPRSWKEVKALGWKAVVAFILFYLIRDTLLYILLPYLIVKGIISF